MSSISTSWFASEEQPALRDFWAVYDANFDTVPGALVGVAPERRAILLAGAHETWRRAVRGDWGPYETHLRAQAVDCARRGLRFESWHATAAAAYAHLTPLLVEAYGSERRRLLDALDVMHRAGERAISIIGEGYFREREAISQEKEHEIDRARRRAERRYGRLVDSGILGVVVGSLERRDVTEINDAALAVVGYERQEILSGTVPWASVTPPDHWRTNERAAAELRATGLVPVLEKEWVHREGYRVPVLVGSAVVEGGDGHHDDEVISFVIDLTERKLTEDALEHLRVAYAADTRFRTLVEAWADAIIVLDAEGRVVIANPQAERTFGYTHGELLGLPVDALVPERFRAVENRARMMGERVDLHGLRKNGSEFPIEVSLIPVETADGVLTSNAIRDVSEGHRTKAALADANHALEAFSYSVAHDLRAPLRGMSGFAQLVIETYGSQLDAEGKDWLAEILKNAIRMGALIDALLSLGQLTRSTLTIARVDISAIAREVLMRLAAAAPDRDVVIEIQAGLEANADRHLTTALLENLLGNAWKFCCGTVDARIDIGARETNGNRVFFVRDNGAGFDMTYASKLFTPFQRLHTTREFPGTGIGLATAQRIVQRHGGSIWAEGIVGAGATFHFTLPNHGTGALS